MIKKKFKTIFTMLITVLLIPTTAFAGSSSETIQLYESDWDTSLIYNSAGGNFIVRMSNVTAGNPYEVKLYEYDGSPTSDDYIKTIYLTGNGDAVFNVSGYVDGTNNKAEIYAKIGLADFPESATGTFIYTD
jgi:hypothetical protein